MVNPIKRVWAWWQDYDTVIFMVRFHAVATWIFFFLIPPSMIWLKNSVPYLVGISVWANFAGHLSAWQAARVERKQDQMEEAAA